MLLLLGASDPSSTQIRSTAEPDVPLAQWPPPHVGPRASLVSRYCDRPSPPSNFLRACQMLQDSSRWKKVKW